MVEYVNYKEPRGPRIWNFGKYSFSSEEIKHLGIAFVMISLTIMVLQRSFLDQIGLLPFIIIFFFTIGLAFLLHELGHKFVAQHYGFMSEFRSDFLAMFLALLVAFTGFTFLAPGAVIILGRVSLRQNGIISVAGPLVNLVLAIFFILLSFIFSPSPNSIFAHIIWLGIWINAFLGVFNMLPFWILDGKKVLAWSRTIYFLVIGALLLILIGSLFGWFI